MDDIITQIKRRKASNQKTGLGAFGLEIAAITPDSSQDSSYGRSLEGWSDEELKERRELEIVIEQKEAHVPCFRKPVVVCKYPSPFA